MPTELYKLSGAGNDFLALVEPPSAPEPELVRAWCRRAVSLGADGLLTLGRTPRGARMVYYNADGSRGELCLNGSRCAVQLAFTLGWHRGELELETDAGTLAGRRLDATRVELELPPIAEVPRPLELETSAGSISGWRVSVGVPHFVTIWPRALAGAPVEALGAELRAHPLLAPAGANVHFVRFPERRRLEIRSFERGVEAETLACGTGAVAGARVGLEAGCLELPATALTGGGFVLELGRPAGGGERSFSLAGDARVLMRAEVFDAAAELPRPPDWSP